MKTQIISHLSSQNHAMASHLLRVKVEGPTWSSSQLPPLLLFSFSLMNSPQVSWVSLLSLQTSLLLTDRVYSVYSLSLHHFPPDIQIAISLPPFKALLKSLFLSIMSSHYYLICPQLLTLLSLPTPLFLLPLHISFQWILHLLAYVMWLFVLHLLSL